MATINPFYRFEVPEANAGFFPECNRVSQILSDLTSLMQQILPSFSNMDWPFAYRNLKQFLKQYNQPFYSADLVIGNFPNPFPPSTGTYSFQLWIYNEQLLAMYPNQYVELNYVMTNGNVVLTPNFAPSVLNVSATLDFPFIAEEFKAINGINIAKANGYAFIERPYFYDEDDNQAKTSLIRGRDWQYSNTYQSAVPVSPILLPMRLQKYPNLPMMSSDAEAVIGLMNQILQLAYEQKTYADLNNAFNSFVSNNQFPNGWTATINGSVDLSKIEMTIYNGDEAIKYFGFDNGYIGFKFQRFYGQGSYSPINFVTYYNPLTSFPIEPPLSGLMYNSFFYDLDFIQFESRCKEPNEFYSMPIKPGDELSFILPQSISNLYDVSDVNIGLFDNDEVFVQKVGEASVEEIPLNCTEFKFVIYGLVNALNQPQDVGFFIIPPLTCPNTIFSGTPEYLYSLNYGGSYPNSPEQFMDDMVANFPSSIGTMSYAIIGTYNSGGNLRNVFEVTWTLNQSFSSGAVATWGLIVNPTIYDCLGYCNTTFGANYGVGVPCSVIDCQKFLFANVTIPNRPNGCYKFGAYINFEGDFILLSMSNPLILDTSDCFSTIIEFYGNEQSINQGFYYPKGWKHRIRLGINGGGAKPKVDENVYRQSNGVFKRPSNKLDYTLDLHTDFLDTPTQKALVDATRHDFMIWNGKNIFVTGDIDVATIQDFTTQSSFEDLAQVKFSVLIQNYQPKNSNCVGC